MNEIADRSYSDIVKATMDAFNEHDFAAAVTCCEDLLAADPQRAEGYFLLGCASFFLGRAGSMLSLFRKAHEMAPDVREYAEVLGASLFRLGNLTEGLFYTKLASALDNHPEFPNFMPPVLRDAGRALWEMRQSRHYLGALRAEAVRNFEQGVDAAREELLINPDHAGARRVLARCLVALGRGHEAVSICNALVHLDPPQRADALCLAEALAVSGHPDRALACLRHYCSEPDAATLTKMLDVLPRCARGAHAGEFRATADRLAALLEETTERFPDRDAVPGGKLRVAFLSDGFFEGWQAAPVEALARALDPQRFDLFCYQQNIGKDGLASRLFTVARDWREVVDIDDETMADIIFGDEIDILVDLCGTGPNSRLAALARHPARVQVSWLGRPEAAGIPGYDVVLADSVTEAGDRALLREGQRLVVLDHMVAVNPPPAIPVTPAPCLEAGHVVFGALADQVTASADAAAVWARILKLVPGSRLVLGGVRGLSPTSAEDFLQLFGHFGVAGRLAFHTGPTDGTAAAVSNQEIHGDFFRHVDIVLDGLPVNAAAIVADALWSGVPVVALAGEGRAASASAVLLNAAGRRHWAPATVEEYVAVAVDLASDMGRLAATRSSLRDEVSRTPLFDTAGFARAVEAAFLELAGEGRS